MVTERVTKLQAWSTDDIWKQRFESIVANDRHEGASGEVNFFGRCREPIAGHEGQAMRPFDVE